MDRENGSSLLYVIAGLLLIGAVGASMARLSPLCSRACLAGASGETARYLALSGLNVAKLMSASELDALVALGDAGRTYQTGEGCAFTLAALAPSGGAYPVRCLGEAGEGGPREAHFILTASITPASSTNLDDYVIASAGRLEVVADHIEGDVHGDGVDMFVGRVDGDVTSTGYIRLWLLALVNGNLCASGDVTIPAFSAVTGNVKSGGSVTAGLGVWIGGSVYAVDDITLALACEVEGDAVCNGRIIGQWYVQGSCIDDMTPVIDCETVTYAPFAYVPASSPSLTNVTSMTFTGATQDFYTNLSFSNNATLTFDLRGGDVEIFVGGNLTFGRNIRIRVIDDSGTRTFTDVYDDDFKEAAAGIYFEVHGEMNMGRDCNWLGTVYSMGDITIASGLRAIGSLISKEGVVIHGSDAVLRHQASNHF